MDDLEFSWADEDPGSCAWCGTTYEHVRPGKSQPTCDCHLFCHAHNPPIKLDYRAEGQIQGWACPVCNKDWFDD